MTPTALHPVPDSASPSDTRLRDLGGHRTAEGRSIRWQQVLLADDEELAGDITVIEATPADIVGALEILALVGDEPVAFRARLDSDRDQIAGALLGALGVPGHQAPVGLDPAYTTRLRALLLL